MLLMKTDKVTIPLYGNSVLVAGKLVKEPKAIGHFQRETSKPTERELTLFYPESVKGKKKDGWINSWGEAVVISVADLVKNGHLDLFEDPAAAEETVKRETPRPEISIEDTDNDR